MDLRTAAALAVVLVVSVLIVATFYNKFWWPPDEGNYAHVAERLRSGEILHRDIQDVHAGLVNFVNAAAFSLFGTRLVSLRYPLAVLTLVQSVVMFFLLRPRGLLPAGIGAVSLTSLTFVQFLDPTANWYCLFLAIATAGWLRWIPAGTRGRDYGIGLLVGTTILFRQLSGVLLGMGVLVFLLLEWPPSRGKDQRGLARALLVIIGTGLAAYLVRATDALGWLLFGLWPFPILVHGWRRTRASNRELGRTLVALGVGALAAALPLIVYHMVHGSLRALVTDAVGAAVSLSGLDFVRSPGYTIMSVLALRGIWLGDFAGRLNGVFWLVLLLLTGILGFVLLRALLRDPAPATVHPLPVLALFYALVAVHYQIPIYLFYTVGLSLGAALWLTTQSGKASRIPWLLCASSLAVIALYYQAAMPLSRGLTGIVAGERRPSATPLRLARGGLYVEAQDVLAYHRLTDLIERETQPGDSIFVVPSNAELYFLANRKNPFKFYNSALGIRSAADLNWAIFVLECHPPKVVFYNPSDKYNTPASVRIAQYVRVSYEPLRPLPPFEVFRRRSRNPSTEGEPGRCTAG